MARLGLQRQAEAEIALEFGSDLGAISDGSPVVRDEHGSFVQGLHRADLAGVKSLNQRRDDAFGFSGERIGLGHQGLLFVLVELRCGDDTHVVAVIDGSAGRTFPIADAYSFHRRKLRSPSRVLGDYAASRSCPSPWEGNSPQAL